MKMVVCYYFGILMYQHILVNHTEQPQDSSFTDEHFAFLCCLLFITGVQIPTRFSRSL